MSRDGEKTRIRPVKSKVSKEATIRRTEDATRIQPKKTKPAPIFHSAPTPSTDQTRLGNNDQTRQIIQEKSNYLESETLPSTDTNPNIDSKVTASSRTTSIADLAKNVLHSVEPTMPISGVVRDNLKEGTIIKNRFVLEKRIGQGGMGTIFLTKDLRKEELKDSDPYTVIKFLNENIHDSIEAIMALQREAKKSQVLSHPNIVTVYDFDRENNIFFLSMEYLRGQSLDTYIAEGAHSYEKKAKLMSLIDYMARGLAYAHQEGFVHADFKPANIFFTENEQIKILDFGIAQAVRSNISHAQNEDTFFDPGSMGALTPNYASLEMLNNERPIPSDDVYALACVAYELLTGKHPFMVEGKRVTAKEAHIRFLQVKPIKGLSKRHMKAIEKGLSYYRKDRFSNAGEFIDAIKPKVKIKQSMVVLIATLVVTMVISWGITAYKSDAAIVFSDLPTSMDNLVDTIKTGDDIYTSGDIDQAHKLYAQAWEASLDIPLVDSRDRFKLKIILDRRVNKIIKELISRSKQDNLDTFSLMQLEIALEFLKKDNLGSLDQDIENALIHIQEKLEKEQ